MEGDDGVNDTNLWIFPSAFFSVVVENRPWRSHQIAIEENENTKIGQSERMLNKYPVAIIASISPQMPQNLLYSQPYGRPLLISNRN